MASKRKTPPTPLVEIRLKRVYDKPAASDGSRVLVDRLWPRGLTKRAAAIDVWAKELAPSHELRRWFGHTAHRYEEFQRRYTSELSGSVERGRRLLDELRDSTITLLYGAKDTRQNNAVVLVDWLQDIAKHSSLTGIELVNEGENE